MKGRCFPLPKTSVNLTLIRSISQRRSRQVGKLSLPRKPVQLLQILNLANSSWKEDRNSLNTLINLGQFCKELDCFFLRSIVGEIFFCLIGILRILLLHWRSSVTFILDDIQRTDKLSVDIIIHCYTSQMARLLSWFLLDRFYTCTGPVSGIFLVGLFASSCFFTSSAFASIWWLGSFQSLLHRVICILRI